MSESIPTFITKAIVYLIFLAVVFLIETYQKKTLRVRFKNAFSFTKTVLFICLLFLIYDLSFNQERVEESVITSFVALLLCGVFLIVYLFKRK
mgnify:CR=1 FL=1